MIPLLSAVFVASLLGSPHCAGMCGPLAILSTTLTVDRVPMRRLLWAYHASRGLGYVTLGLLAGMGGALLDTGTSWLGLQQTAAMIAGACMAALGVISLLRLAAKQSFHFRTPAVLEKFLSRAHRSASQMPAMTRALMIGGLTVFLPCGWLYAFFISAMGTAHPLLGAGVMGVFWVGTLPALLVVTFGARRLTRSMSAYLPWVTACLLVVTGVYTAGVRARADMTQLGQSLSTVTDPVDGVLSLSEKEMPCCHVE